MGAAHHVPISAIEAISDRLALENQLRAKLIATGQLWCALDTLSASSKSSEVYQLLNLYPPEPLAFALMQPNQPDWRMEEIRNYLTHLRGIQPLITGDDLIQLGLKPGRAFADVLWKAFAAQLDGKVSTKQEACQHLGY
jgi:tRNA nucleotidyltransferase (CCA-adding enzyme)